MLEKIKKEYDIISTIGQGGMAQIYLARDKLTQKKVAIKVLHPSYKNHIAAKKRFESEIRLSKKIDSPYVSKFYDYQLDDEAQFIIMEYIEGETLKNYIQRRTTLTTDEVVEFTKQLALGFNEIHNAGITHRDIKNTNIMVTIDGTIKIIDFGIAIDDQSESLTKTGHIIGSAQYIPPEVIDQLQLNEKADIYSLGILMYEMLTGSVPYTDSDIYKVVLKHKNAPMIPVNKIVESIPQSLANIVTKATQKDRKKRYKNMMKLYNDLTTCLDASRALEEPINLDNKQSFNIITFINSNKVLVSILLAILIALILIIILMTVVIL